MADKELILKLSDIHGVAGFEDDVREFIKTEIEPFVDELTTDPLGNLIAVKKGRGEFKLMLDAHMDEVGFIVSSIERDGFIRFVPLGGWDPRIILAHLVEIKTRSGDIVQGVIGAKPPHILTQAERRDVIPIDELFIDIGAASRDEVIQRGVHEGDPVVIHYPAREIHDGVLVGKAFDNRVGCAMMIEIARNLKDELPFDLYLAFTMGEEIGLRGARTVAASVQPDIGLSLEGTIGADMPGVPERKKVTSLGKGPVITIADKTIVVPRKMIMALEDAAREAGIPFQYKLPGFGGTNAGVIHTSGKGAVYGVVAVPARYIHSPVSLMYFSDYDASLKLVMNFLGNVDRLRGLLA